MLLLNHIYSLIIGYVGRIIKPLDGAINKIFLYPYPNAIDNNINNIKNILHYVIPPSFIHLLSFVIILHTQ